MLDMDALLAPDGPFAAAIDDYAPRTSQRLMAQAVADALAHGESLLVEAGTGTGKTFAYLLPALLGGARTIVSTGTRALQDQLYHRDLPTVSRALGRPVTTALLKGRANYLCLHRLERALQDATAMTAAQAAVLSDWRQRTTSGDRAEVEAIGEDDPLWARVTSTTDNCLGQQCAFFDDCHVVRARRAAQRADLVVVNHHLLLADLAFREGGFVEFLPDADAVIIDEAHQLPDIALEFFGSSVSHRQCLDVFDELEVGLAALGGEPLVGALRTARTALLQAREQAPREPGRYEADRIGAGQREALGALTAAFADLIDVVDSLGELEPPNHQQLDRLVRISDRLQVASADSDEEGMRWLTVTPRGIRWHMTPLDVAERMRAAIDASGAAWVLTSATLAVGEDFSHVSARLGLDDARCVQFATPFPVAERARVLLPPNLPPANSPEHIGALLEQVAPLLDATAGGAFFLHTSYRGLHQSAQWFRDRPARFEPRELLVQGDAPRDRLLTRFRAAGNAILLGTGTFWEGVDVRGPALVLVVIDKLPFAAPDDPLLVARSAYLRQAGLNPFMAHQLPEAVLALKQGAGRLLRDASDYGVVVLGDRRVTDRGYGKTFLQALAPMPRLAEVNAAADFLRECERSGDSVQVAT